MNKVNEYTSTGIKFWEHPQQMENYKKSNGHTIISTHISPEGACNLNCLYCSVKRRRKSFRIDPNVIVKYIDNLMTRGLKAVILTGGGEPTFYPFFNEIVNYIVYEKNLRLGLITNGTLLSKNLALNYFDWIRVSINNGILDYIDIPSDIISSDCTIGASMILDHQNELIPRDKLLRFVDKINAKYVRVIPDCLLTGEDLMRRHNRIEEFIANIKDDRFFHQKKLHDNPGTRICHQSFFRPYLSEVNGGTVYACDSIVLNDKIEYFHNKYQLCKAEDVLDYLDGKIKPKFSPVKDCDGCVFSDTVRMLHDFKKEKNIDYTYCEYPDIKHKDFV